MKPSRDTGTKRQKKKNEKKHARLLLLRTQVLHTESKKKGIKTRKTRRGKKTEERKEAGISTAVREKKQKEKKRASHSPF